MLDRFALPAKIPRELLAPRADPTLFALACKSLLFGFGFCSWEYAVADVGPHHAIVVPLRRVWQSQHVYGPIEGPLASGSHAPPTRANPSSNSPLSESDWGKSNLDFQGGPPKRYQPSITMGLKASKGTGKAQESSIRPRNMRKKSTKKAGEAPQDPCQGHSLRAWATHVRNAKHSAKIHVL